VLLLAVLRGFSGRLSLSYFASISAEKVVFMSPADAPTPERIMQFAFGYAPTLILEAALHHRMFDALDEQPKSVAEIAEETGTSQRGVRAICDALVGFEFLAKDKAGKYSNT